MTQTLTKAIAQVIAQARRARALREIINSETLSHAVKLESAEELLALVESISINAERMLQIADAEEPAPQLCSQCLRFLTMTRDQLDEYIVLIAQQAARVSWPQEVAEQKLRNVLRRGDQVVWIGYGVLNVRREDGELIAVYQRDS